MKISGIYAIVNTVNGNRYVGSSQDIEKRFMQHRCDLRRGEHHSGHLQGAWNLYGESSFALVVIEECLVGKLLEREQFHIDEKSEYNIAIFAGAGMRGRKASPETRAKLSAMRMGQKPTKGFLGREHTEATKRKMAEAAKGHSVSDSARKKIADAHKNRSDEDARKRSEKISKSRRGKSPSEKTRQNMSKAQIGRKHSEETKRRIGESNYRKYQERQRIEQEKNGQQVLFD